MHTELVSKLLCRSISELCILDHQNDPTIIAKWTSNKTPSHILKWLESSETYLIVALLNDDIPAGVGAFGTNGEVFLNFVSPDYRFKGISKALLKTMEHRLKQLGIENGSLYSTATALDFYRDAGWIEHGTPDVEFGVIGYPMMKKIGL